MAQLIPVDTFDLIIFGGTGDLAMRKLLPALYHRDLDGQVTADSRIIAASRGALTRDKYLALVEKSLREKLPKGEFDAAHWKTFKKRIHYVQADAFAHDNWGRLVKKLSGHEERTRVAYLATAPSLFGALLDTAVATLRERPQSAARNLGIDAHRSFRQDRPRSSPGGTVHSSVFSFMCIP